MTRRWKINEIRSQVPLQPAVLSPLTHLLGLATVKRDTTHTPNLLLLLLPMPPTFYPGVWYYDYAAPVRQLVTLAEERLKR